MQTRTHTDRHGDRWTTYTGPLARALRAEIRADQDAALTRRDQTERALAFAIDINVGIRLALIAFCAADTEFARLADTEGEIARRAAEQRERRAA